MTNKTGPQQFLINESEWADVWKDTVRIQHDRRHDDNGKPVRRGQVCRIKIGEHSKWVIAHGRDSAQGSNPPIIQMDLNTRLALETDVGKVETISIKQIGWIRSLWFPWLASDPLLRLPAQLAFISFVLGVIGVVLGVLALWHPEQH